MMWETSELCMKDDISSRLPVGLLASLLALQVAMQITNLSVVKAFDLDHSSVCHVLARVKIDQSTALAQGLHAHQNSLGPPAVMVQADYCQLPLPVLSSHLDDFQ